MSHTVHCPLCGLEQVTNNLALDDPLAEAERVQALIDRLVEQRGALLRRANNQKSSTGKLPPEIISIIFRLACQPSDPFNPRTTPPVSPIILRAVSSYWREIVNSSTPLWISPIVRSKVNDKNVDKVVSLLQRCFRKYGYLGLAIELDFQNQMEENEAVRERREELERMIEDADEDDEYEGNLLKYEEELDDLGEDSDLEYPLVPLLDVIFKEYPDQIKTLRLINPPNMVLLDCRYDRKYIAWNKFIRLEKLHFIWKGYGYSVSGWKFYKDLEDVPKLQELVFHDAAKMKTCHNDISSILYSTNITNLHLFEIPYNACLQLLILCKNLQSCLMIHPHSSTSCFKLAGAGDIESKSKLEILEWTFCRIFGSLSVLPVAFPDLRTLVLHNVWERHGTTVLGLESILSQLPASCKSLILSTDLHYNPKISHNVPVTVLRQITAALEHIPDTVTEVGLRSSCVGFVSVINIGEDQDSASLNKISKISIINDRRDCKNRDGGGRCHYCQGSNAFKSSGFVKAMRVRLGVLGAGSSFCFEYDTDCVKVDWNAADQARLRELEDQGLDLYIFEDGKLVNWL